MQMREAHLWIRDDAYYSRISNKDVLRSVGAVKLSALLLEQQLLFPDVCGGHHTILRRSTLGP